MDPGLVPRPAFGQPHQRRANRRTEQAVTRSALRRRTALHVGSNRHEGRRVGEIHVLVERMIAISARLTEFTART